MYSIILLLLVVVIFKILFKTFGYINDEEARRKNEAIKTFLNLYNSGKLQRDMDDEKSANDTKVIISVSNNSDNNKNFNSIINFDDKIFLKIVEKIIVNFIEFFNDKKLNEIKNMCSESLFNNLSANMKNLTDDGKEFKTTIINFKDKQILEKDFNSYNKYVKIKITTDQINYIKQGDNIINGYDNKVQSVSEVWKFVCDDVKNNVWLIDSIDEFIEEVGNSQVKINDDIVETEQQKDGTTENN